MASPLPSRQQHLKKKWKQTHLERGLKLQPSLSNSHLPLPDLYCSSAGLCCSSLLFFEPACRLRNTTTRDVSNFMKNYRTQNHLLLQSAKHGSPWPSRLWGRDLASLLAPYLQIRNIKQVLSQAEEEGITSFGHNKFSHPVTPFSSTRPHQSPPRG